MPDGVGTQTDLKEILENIQRQLNVLGERTFSDAIVDDGLLKEFRDYQQETTHLITAMQCPAE